MNTKYFKSLKIIIPAVVLFATGSCKKYLDQQPITSVGPDVVFNDVPGAYGALISVYANLTGDQGYGRSLSLYLMVDNDEMMGPTGVQDDRRGIAHYTLTAANSELEKPFNQLFRGIEYANICIDKIPKMDLFSSGSDKEKKQLQRMLGEALTLRAQFYFEAIRNWGDLPAHFTPAYALAADDPLPRKTGSDTLYNHLLDDLKQAETLVPWRNELAAIGDPSDERITKGAVKGLRARIALFRGGYSLKGGSGALGTMQRAADYLAYYQIAKDECNELMASGQHSLNPSFRALWKDQVGGRVVNDPNGELMFQATGIGAGGAEDTKLGYYDGPRVNSFGNSAINPLPTYFYLFDSTDLRRDVTIAPYNVGADGATKIGLGTTALNDGKYRRDWMTNPVIAPSNQAQYFQLKWQIMRYSDILLMYAEAENELNGPTTTAYNAINQVRRRGYGLPIATASATVDIAGLTKATFFAAIVRERALELGGEGIRKFDLIRWNLLNTAFTETKANLLKMSTSAAISNTSYMAAYPAYSISTTIPTSMYYFTATTSDNANIGGIFANSLYKTAPGSTPAGTTKITWASTSINTTVIARLATGFTAGKSELLPLPQPTIDANYNLKQNPGY